MCVVAVKPKGANTRDKLLAFTMLVQTFENIVAVKCWIILTRQVVSSSAETANDIQGPDFEKSSHLMLIKI